jgi:hypothetical protein
MSEVRDRTFTGNETVEVDGTSFFNCRFESASFRFAGGELPQFHDCVFVDVGWYFTGPALRTIQLLQTQNLEGGAAAMLADLFKPGNVIGE